MAKSATLSNFSPSALQAEIKRRAKQHKMLMAKREKLVDQVEEIDTQIDDIEQILLLGSATGGAPPIGRKRFSNEMNLIKTLKKALKGKEMGVTEAVIAVKSIGYKSTSPNFRTIVNQTMSNHPKHFKRLSRGVYTSK